MNKKDFFYILQGYNIYDTLDNFCLDKLASPAAPFYDTKHQSYLSSTEIPHFIIKDINFNSSNYITEISTAKIEITTWSSFDLSYYSHKDKKRLIFQFNNVGINSRLAKITKIICGGLDSKVIYWKVIYDSKKQ